MSTDKESSSNTPVFYSKEKEQLPKSKRVCYNIVEHNDDMTNTSVFSFLVVDDEVVILQPISR